MSALEEWLMLLLLEHNVNMLRVEAEAKSRVLALLILMQKDVVSILANAPAMSELGKLGKNAILRESNAVIAEYYGKAQLQVDLFGIAEVESMGVKRALEAVMDGRTGKALDVAGSARADVVSKFTDAAERQLLEAPVKADAARSAARVAAKAAGAEPAAIDAVGNSAYAARMQVSANNAIKIGDAASSGTVEIRIGVGLPTENYLNKLASDVLIQGSPAKNWWLRQAQDTQFKLANEIRIGAAQGETNAQIIKRIVGQDATVRPATAAEKAAAADTSAKAGKPGADGKASEPGKPAAPDVAKPAAKAAPDVVVEPGTPGVMPLARKNAAAIVQTSVATVAAEARRATFQANRDITNGIIQISTLDGNTSLTCVAYSGAQWDNDYEPINGNDLPYNGGVPRHWGCRSSEASIMKTLREMGIDMDEPDPGMRASSDGPISAKTTFADFLKLKGADYQNEVLGPGRAELFRQGKLGPRDLVSAAGQPLKLSDLRAKYAQ
jgi:hypothetical protein